MIWKALLSGARRGPGPQPRPRGTPVLSSPPHCTLEPGGWPRVAPYTTHSSGSLLSGVWGQSLWPVSLCPSGWPPPRPALTGNLTPTPKFGLRKQMRGGNQNPHPSKAGIGSGRAGFLQAVDCLKVWGPCVCVGGAGGGKGSHVRMVALELKIAECRERVISLSAVLPGP